MILKRSIVVLFVLMLSSCATDDNKGRISELEKVKIPVKDVEVKGGLDKAMQAYQKFLEKTPDSELTPEAIRRLADLKIEKTYGTVTDEDSGNTEKKATSTPKPNQKLSPKSKATASQKSDIKDLAKNTARKSQPVKTQQAKSKYIHSKSASIANVSESQTAFEKRATQHENIKSEYSNTKLAVPAGEPGSDLQNADASQAIALYNKLLAKYPRYERNDQVLYQLSRAYDETGQVNKAMGIMNRLIKQYPRSRYIDEVQFRRGEYYFTRRKYLDAEDAYKAVLSFGVGSVYYAHALFKLGWTFYKQELYDEAIAKFIKLLDYQVSIGYDFEQTSNKIEKKRTDDTFRVISLAFSNLGGAKTVQDFFAKNGSRTYEDDVYSHLAEFYFTKRRYSDAATTYNAFIEKNPFHKKSPFFSMRVIDIYMKGGFPKLVIEAKKQYASTYGVHAEYWKYFDQKEFPEVLGYVKTNIFDLAKYYHSLYQDKKHYKDKPKNFAEASHWYKEFLDSFPKDKQSPAINFQLAELLLENKNYNDAAKEYERTAYDYPQNDKSEQAAYAAVYAYRQYVKAVPEIRQLPVKRDIIRSSLRLVDTYPHHKKATVVLGAAVDDLFNLQDYKPAIKNGLRLIGEYPNAEGSILRGAWLVVAHSNFQLENFADAETGYTEVLSMTGEKDKDRPKLVENLAASIYKQGEQAKQAEDYKTAVWHFLRIAKAAPNSKIRPTAEYDAAAVLIQTMDLERAVKVLLAFRKNYPKNDLQHDVTKKIAYAYKELGKYTLAGKEFERVAVESKDEELIREAMLSAADMYGKAKDVDNSLRVYHQFVLKFPKPLEFALETYYKMAMLYKSVNDLGNYRKTLMHIISADAGAGKERTDRTRYLAAESSLVIIEPKFNDFVAIKLVNPLKKSIKKKERAMKALITAYSKLVSYKVADVTAASTFYLAEIYYNFDRSLLASEVPKGLSALELEEFRTQLEDQAYPFETKAIKVHEKNVELLGLGIYSPWIDRSIEKLAKLVPARFAKYETRMSYLENINSYRYASPRFKREDAPTVYVENMKFFRYVSQIAKINNHGQPQSDDKKVTVEKSAADASVPSTGEKQASGQEGVEQPVGSTGKNMSQGAVSSDTVPQKQSVNEPPATVTGTGSPAAPVKKTQVDSKATEAPEKDVQPTSAVNNSTPEANSQTAEKQEVEATQGAPSSPVRQKDSAVNLKTPVEVKQSSKAVPTNGKTPDVEATQGASSGSVSEPAETQSSQPVPAKGNAPDAATTQSDTSGSVSNPAKSQSSQVESTNGSAPETTVTQGDTSGNDQGTAEPQSGKTESANEKTSDVKGKQDVTSGNVSDADNTKSQQSQAVTTSVQPKQDGSIQDSSAVPNGQNTGTPVVSKPSATGAVMESESTGDASSSPKASN